MPKREPGLSDPPPAPRYFGLSWWPPIDPAWPEGQLAAFQCDFCWHAVKALQSSKPTCEPDLYGRRRRCHGRLMQGPYFPPAWLQGCVDCSLRKGASAWEVFLAGAEGAVSPTGAVFGGCSPRSEFRISTRNRCFLPAGGCLLLLRCCQPRLHLGDIVYICL